VKEFPAVAGEANRLLPEWAGVEIGREFVEDRLRELTERPPDLLNGIAKVDRGLEEVKSARASAAAVGAALRDVDAVNADLKPHEQKELVRLLLRRVEVGDREIVLEIYAGAGGTGAQVPNFAKSVEQRYGRPIWLPDEDSNLEPSG
jgi:protein subunit release factor A